MPRLLSHIDASVGFVLFIKVTYGVCDNDMLVSLLPIFSYGSSNEVSFFCFP